MTYRIIWRPSARNDLYALYDWIADQADPDTAYAYTARIEALAAKLIDFPARDTPRDDLSHHLRTITFERRIIIAYRIEGKVVVILRIVHTAQDYAALLAP